MADKYSNAGKYAKRQVKKQAKKHPAAFLVILLIFALIAGGAYLLDSLGIINIFGNSTINRTSIAEGKAELHFIDVGQGDCALIRTSEGNILIDCGPRDAKDAVLKYFSDNGIDKIKYAVFTHPHEDHMGCAAEILEKIEVENIIMPDAVSTAKYYEAALDVIEKKNINVIKAKSGDKYSLGGFDMTVISPNSEKYSNTNNYSVVILADFGDTSFMFTGDAEKLAEDEILKKYGNENLKCTLLKVGHHGSDTSTSESFLKAVSPEYAVISVGANNSYGHPCEETLLLLEKYNVKYYTTEKEGTIVFVSDGTKLERKQ